MRITSPTVLFAGLLLAVTASVTGAANSPRLFNYQGRLTDAGGTALPDGPKSVRFIIWNDPTATSPVNEIWNSGPLVVTTDKGLFSVLLGASPQPTLSPALFQDSSRWLGITVGADPEISPRTHLTSTAYAFTAENAVTSGSTNSAPGYLPLSGGAMSGATTHDNSIDVWQWAGDARTRISPIDASIITYGADNLEQTRLWGSSWGELQLRNNQPANTETVSLTGVGNSGNGGALWLFTNSGITGVYLDAGATSDGSVQLPDSAISAHEILDEPGIVSNQGFASTTLTGTMQDLVTVTITTPAAGYISLSGLTTVEVSGTTGTNIGYLQIDETAGGSTVFPYAVLFGQGTCPNSNTMFIAAPTHRVYFKPAGTYTFRLEGCTYCCNGTGAQQKTDYPVLTAYYFPTSYGTVTTVAGNDDNRPFDSATPATVTEPFTGVSHAVKLVDLRDLELKAARARSDANAAERKLAEAKLAQRINQDNQSAR